MAMILLITVYLIDFIVSSIQKSRKSKLSSFTTIKPWLIFVRVVMSTCFFVEEIIEAVSSIAKRWPRIKD